MKYTTEQVKKMVFAFREDMASRGIEVGKVWRVKFGKSAHTFGRCTFEGHNMYTITINDIALHGEVIDTIVHELIHTVKGCMNHGKKFHEIADMCNKLYNLDIGTHASKKEVEACKEYRLRTSKYVIQCTKCGNTIFRTRSCRLVNHPNHYSCVCGGELRRIR